jgi:hypothetical protein
LIRYCEKVFSLSEAILVPVSDERLMPRIATAVALKASLTLFWARLGSLHALETTRAARFWKQWLGEDLCSADTLGRVHAQMDTDKLRKGLQQIYARLKRNKALSALAGLEVAVVDGHETHCSYRRHCSGCLTRTLHTTQGQRLQYYHRHVTMMLLGEKLRLLLDMEAQRPGEGEVVTAVRLLERVLKTYSRAFSSCWPMLSMLRRLSSTLFALTASMSWWFSKTTAGTSIRTS